eukprot:TRINITY_DN1252_c0_g1_i7.p1 TRINITY_DN1252_c0_g1~~TRINITY_DN1252_c0_g1_i7.p1  ORF type:complete len:347 (+),score=33.50 TRINITY_DN1252_c0_g1_i7:42-1082(+)
MATFSLSRGSRTMDAPALALLRRAGAVGGAECAARPVQVGGGCFQIYVRLPSGECAAVECEQDATGQSVVQDLCSREAIAACDAQCVCLMLHGELLDLQVPLSDSGVTSECVLEARTAPRWNPLGYIAACDVSVSPSCTRGCLLMGESRTGKTALRDSWSSGELHQMQENTMGSLGIDFKLRNLRYRGDPLKVHIWDSDGGCQQSFPRWRGLARLLHMVDVKVVVYDVWNSETFTQARAILAAEPEMPRRPGYGPLGLVLLGAKADDAAAVPRPENHTPTRVPTQDAAALAAEHGAAFAEVSAVTGAGLVRSLEMVVVKAFECRPYGVPARPRRTPVNPPSRCVIS